MFRFAMDYQENLGNILGINLLKVIQKMLPRPPQKNILIPLCLIQSMVLRGACFIQTCLIKIYAVMGVYLHGPIWYPTEPSLSFFLIF